MSGFCVQLVKKSKIFMEILDFLLFWHSHCKLFRSVISFSVINYVVSMRCPRVSDDSSFFFALCAKKMSLSFLPPVRLCLTAPVGHTEPSKAVRASPRLHCIPSLHRYGLSRIALCARIRYNCQKWLVKVS